MRYKTLVRKLVERYRKQNDGFRQSDLATSLRIEPSYLSRFLSDPKVHFSEELLFQLVHWLKASDAQIEKIITLCALERGSTPAYKAYLQRRLSRYRVTEIRHEIDEIKTEIEILAQLVNQTEHFAEKEASEGL